MANPNFIKPEALRRLPPGFRFHPTDEELILQYLKRKAFSFPLPAAFIPEIDLGKYGPWELPGAGEQERYFFYQRAAKYPNGGRVNRAIGCGHWKAAGKDKPIFGSKSKEVIGMKKVLVFYHGKPSVGSKTNWVMHEYRLAGAGAGGGAGDGFCSFGKKNKLVHSAGHSRKDWVLCRIYMKKRSAVEDGGEEEGNNLQRERVLRLFNFMKEHEGAESLSSTSSSSSDLSCVTDQSDRMMDDSDDEK